MPDERPSCTESRPSVELARAGDLPFHVVTGAGHVLSTVGCAVAAAYFRAVLPTSTVHDVGREVRVQSCTIFNIFYIINITRTNKCTHTHATFRHRITPFYERE